MSASPQPNTPRRLSKEGRTSSLVGGFMRRSKSNDPMSDRKSSGRASKLLSESEQEEQLRRQKQQNQPPKLPGLPQQEQMQTFGGDDYRPRMSVNSKNDVPPVPPIPAGLENAAVDPYARTESMTNRGRYSYARSVASTLNSPRRVRRRKDPTPYNVLIIGAQNSGKTSFLNFLKQSLALPPTKQPSKSFEPEHTPPSSKLNRSFVHHYQEIEVESERIGLTLWDSQGLDKSVVDLQMREISNFVESKFDDTFIEETRVVRAPILRDTHIHCVFLILDPLRLDANIRAAQQANDGSQGRATKVSHIVGALDEDFDVQVLRMLQGKTTVIPVISKADTVTTTRMAYLKKMVLQGLRQAGLDPLEALNIGMDESDDEIINEVDEEDEDEKIPATVAETDADTGTAIEGIATSNTTKKLAHKREASTVSNSDIVLNSGYIPFSLLSPDEQDLKDTSGPIGRRFPWGFADPYSEEHCDFVRLKEACFKEWRSELREASREIFYERWRTSRLNRSSANGHRSSAGPRKASGGIPIGLTARAK